VNPNRPVNGKAHTGRYPYDVRKKADAELFMSQSSAQEVNFPRRFFLCKAIFSDKAGARTPHRSNGSFIQATCMDHDFDIQLLLLMLKAMTA
jgi:hypothetical protein